MDKLGKYLKKYERITANISKSKIHPTQKALLTLYACFACSLSVLGHFGAEKAAYFILVGSTLLFSLLLLLHGYYTKKQSKD